MQFAAEGHGSSPVSGLAGARVRAPVPDAPVLSGEPGTLQRFERDQEIFGEGCAAEHLYMMTSGVARTSKLLSDGRRQIDAFHLPGDIFGIEMGRTHRVTAEAVGRATVRVMRRRDCGTLPRHDPEWAGRLLRALAQSLERAQSHVLLLGRKSAREKIASFLLDFASRTQGANNVELPMLRMDIADHLGLTIETVSRTLTQLQCEKLIDLPAGRRTIVLRDACALRQLDAGTHDDGPAYFAPSGAKIAALAAN